MILWGLIMTFAMTNYDKTAQVLDIIYDIQNRTGNAYLMILTILSLLTHFDAPVYFSNTLPM